MCLKLHDTGTGCASQGCNMAGYTHRVLRKLSAVRTRSRMARTPFISYEVRPIKSSFAIREKKKGTEEFPVRYKIPRCNAAARKAPTCLGGSPGIVNRPESIRIHWINYAPIFYLVLKPPRFVPHYHTISTFIDPRNRVRGNKENWRPSRSERLRGNQMDGTSRS